MKNIIEDLENKVKVYKLRGATASDIAEAERELNLKFCSEYKELLSLYGTISFLSHEFKGLGTSGYLNVVEETKKERELNQNFPKDCIVLENEGIEGFLTLMDSTGSIYSFCNGNKELLAFSLKDYIKKTSKA